jgi:putative ABC transport system permease protein
MYNLKLIIRKLFREKLTTIALLFSLIVGFVAFIAISSYVIYEKTYDRYIPDYNKINRIVTEVYSNNELAITMPQCERILGEALVEKFPNVTSSGFMCKTNNPHYKIEENIFTSENVFHASSGLIDILSIKLINSKKAEVLTEPYKVIISESTAKKYFGNKNPIGETIFKYPAYEYEVEGVFKDLPKNTHFEADMFLSFHNNMNLPPPLKDNWGETSFYTYLKVNKSANIKNLEKNIDKLVYENKKSYFDNTNSINKYHLQAIKDIHLKSNLKSEITINAKNSYLNILLIVSLLILLASGFNYVYFIYTRVLSNTKDIGIKKVFGITKKHLITQFLTESFFIHAIAIIISFIICTLLQGLIYNSLGIDISLSYKNFNFWIVCIAIYILSSTLTVIFPILVLKNKKALELLHYKKKQKKHAISFRQLITITQFVIIILIISVIIGVDKQVNYLISKDKGINISNNLVLKVPQNLRKTSRRINNLDAFEQELLKYPEISLISSSSAVPGDLLAYNFNASEKGKANSVKSAIYITDNSFLEIFNVKLLAGGNFSENLSQENAGCIINMACSEKLGYSNPSDATGRILNLNDESQMQSFEIPIVGVCKDYNFQSMKESPDPIILLDWTQNMLWGNYILKMNDVKDFSTTNSFIRDLFLKTFPNYPYEYFWLDDHYNKQYKEEQRLTLLLKFFVSLTILISIINLFSMVWHITLLRTKEIGIRKVNGASAMEIIKMLNIDFLKWIFLATIIACPISYYSLYKWLEGFAYKTTLSWWIFILSGVFALFIGALTVSWQSYKVANMNPANALRHE